MRPIYGTGAGNLLGANANNANPRPTIAPHRAYMSTLRVSGEQSFAPSGPPPSALGHITGMISRNATFKDAATGMPSYSPLGRPIGAALWKAPYTGPAAIVVVRPKIRSIPYQVTNTDVRHRMPGWTYNLPININTQIGQAIRRQFMHTGA